MSGSPLAPRCEVLWRELCAKGMDVSLCQRYGRVFVPRLRNLARKPAAALYKPFLRTMTAPPCLEHWFWAMFPNIVYLQSL
jgi:hypothetical protein